MAAITFEALFIPWYLIMIATMYRTAHADPGHTDHVSGGLAAVMVVALLSVIWTIWVLATVTLPIPQLLAKLALEVGRAIAVTYFMWHLRGKELIREWLNSDR